MLGAALLAIGLLLIGLAAVLAQRGCSFAIVWRVALPGIVLLGAVIAERWRYRRLSSSHPGPGWVATTERFVDPESGKLVTVYYNPSTGERRYVGA